MRKKSPYARKMAHNPTGTVTYRIGDFVVARAKKMLHGVDNVVARCTPYKDNEFFDYKPILLQVHLALEGFINKRFFYAITHPHHTRLVRVFYYLKHEIKNETRIGKLEQI